LISARPVEKSTGTFYLAELSSRFENLVNRSAVFSQEKNRRGDLPANKGFCALHFDWQSPC
jgi:hypothetical protein